MTAGWKPTLTTTIAAALWVWQCCLMRVKLMWDKDGAVVLFRTTRYRRSTWVKSSSTGVSRPKKETSTRTFPFSRLISSTVPMKS
jgi:hypothetical protein